MDKSETRRISVDVPEELHREVKARAARRDLTIKELVVDLLVAWLAGELPAPDTGTEARR